MSVAEAVERRLYDAAMKGQVITLEELHQQDPFIHHGVPFAGSRNLLHVATMCGQVSIVEEVLKIDGRLARIQDSHNLSPLHIAVAEGNLDIARKLVSKSPEMCWLRDDQGMNPVHTAAMKGHVDVLEELLQQDLLPAMERVDRGQSVLHLCLKHRQVPAFMVLVDKLGDLVSAVDDDGETVMHLAVRSKQLEAITYLVKYKKIENLTKNSMGKTAMDLLNESPPGTTPNFLEFKNTLTSLEKHISNEVWYKLDEMTMVVLVLIATMAFQAAVSPPGGVWQDDTSSHRAGESVMASTHPQVYKHFKRANTTAFVSSLVTIFLSTTRLTIGFRAVVWLARLATWVSLASIAVSYGASLTVITPGTGAQSFAPTILIVALVSASMYVGLIVYLMINKSFKEWKIRKRQVQGYRDHRLSRRLLHRIFQWYFDRYCEDYSGMEHKYETDHHI